MGMRTLIPFIGVVLVALLPSSGGAAESTFGEEVDVSLVNVEVWVSDRRGDPVVGLDATDFQVQHDGEPVALSHFVEVRGGKVVPLESSGDREEAAGPEAETPLARGTVAPDEAQKGHLILYFDQLHLSPRSYAGLVASLRSFLASAPLPADRVLVLRQDRRLYVEVPFGSTAEVLDEALRALAESDSRVSGLDSSSEQALGEIRSAWQQAESLAGSRAGGLSAVPTVPGPPGSDPGGGGGSPQAAVGGTGSSMIGADACDIFLNQIEPIVDGWARRKSQHLSLTLQHLSQAGVFLAGLPGVKTFLYLSDGLEAQPGAAFASYIGSLCPTGSSSAMMSALSEELSRTMARLTRHLNSNRITLYSLQTSGLEASATGSAAAGGGAIAGGSFRAANAYEFSQRQSERDGLVFLARETGGESVFNQNDLARGLEGIVRDMSSYYSLAYVLPASTDSREHRIEVMLREAGPSLRYRRGFLEKDPAQRLSEKLEGALNLGLVENPLGAGLGAGKLQASGEGRFKLPLHVFVPVGSLTFLEDEEGAHATLYLQVLIRNLASQKIDQVERRLRIRLPAGSQDERVAFAVELDLKPGSQAIAVGLQDETSRETSFVTTSLEIPADG